MFGFPVQAPMFRKSRLLYLYCVDPGYVSELTTSSSPLFAHVSFPGSLSEPAAHGCECKRVFNKTKDVVSPCVIEVISSGEFHVRISKCNNKFPACLKTML